MSDSNRSRRIRERAERHLWQLQQMHLDAFGVAA